MEQIIKELESEVSYFNNITTTTSTNKKKFSNTKKYESIMHMFHLFENLWKYLHSNNKEYRHKSQIEETIRNINKIFESMNDTDTNCQLIYFLSICVKTIPTENINFHYEILMACICSCSKLKLCIHYVLLNIVKPLTDEQCWNLFSRINHEVSEDYLKMLLNHPKILQEKERVLMNYASEKLYIRNELDNNVYVKIKYLKENLGIQKCLL